MANSYTLFELNEYIRRVIALNFSEPIWIQCEISQIKEVRGNVYLDLVQQDESSHQIIAQISASIWYKSYLFIRNKLGNLLPSILKEGAQVKMKGIVEYNERYGIKFIIEDIDPAFTIGLLEMKKQKIIQQLKDEGLYGLNSQRQLPKVIQNIAVISSSKAAGYVDFTHHLEENPYGYKIHVDLYEASMQGQNTEREICQAIEDIHKKSVDNHCICILRGGGGKTDLSSFDSYNIGAAISKSILPVLTGIGHEIDTSVADLVAFRNLKTPTALADYILEHNSIFETEILEIGFKIGRYAELKIKQNQLNLQYVQQMLHVVPNERVQKEFFLHKTFQQNIDAAIRKILYTHQESLKNMERIWTMSDPKQVLKKGYAIIRQGKSIVKSAEDMNSDKSIDIEFYKSNAKIQDYSLDIETKK